jgi:hypothetical protein
LKLLFDCQQEPLLGLDRFVESPKGWLLPWILPSQSWRPDESVTGRLFGDFCHQLFALPGPHHGWGYFLTQPALFFSMLVSKTTSYDQYFLTDLDF